MLPSTERRPWPTDPRYLVGADGTIIGPSGRQVGSGSDFGYTLITYRTEKGRTCTSAHAMVCETFHGPRPHPAAQAAHRNGDPADNRAENLRWETRTGNMADRIAHGTNGIRLTAEQVGEIRARHDEARAVLAQEYGVTPGTISHIRTGRTWRAR